MWTLSLRLVGGLRPLPLSPVCFSLHWTLGFDTLCDGCNSGEYKTRILGGNIVASEEGGGICHPLSKIYLM